MNFYHQIFKQELDGTGITVVKKRFLNKRGRAYEDNAIKIPKIQCYESLAVGIHEIVHIKLDHLPHFINKTKPVFVLEFEAETHTLAVLRSYNLHVGEYRSEYLKYLKKARIYVKSHIPQNYKVPYKIKKWLKI